MEGGREQGPSFLPFVGFLLRPTGLVHLFEDLDRCRMARERARVNM